MAVPTPEAPKNTFDEGATESVDRQKAALTELLASQGATGLRLLQNRGADAGAIAAQAKAQYGDAGKPVSDLYQTFERDAQQRTNAHNEEQARIQAANRAYMDQVGAAIPLQRQDSENYMNALRMEFEDRQRQREAEEQARQAAAARAASAASSSSLLAKLLEKKEADNAMAKLEWTDTGPMERTPSMAKAAGAAGGERSIIDAAAAIGMDPEAAKRRWVERQDSQFREQDDALIQAMRDMLSEAVAKDVPWRSVLASAQSIASEIGLDYRANVQPWLATVSGLWGVEDKDWLSPLAQGQGSGYKTYGQPSGGGAIYEQ